MLQLQPNGEEALAGLRGGGKEERKRDRIFFCINAVGKFSLVKVVSFSAMLFHVVTRTLRSCSRPSRRQTEKLDEYSKQEGERLETEKVGVPFSTLLPPFLCLVPPFPPASLPHSPPSPSPSRLPALPFHYAFLSTPLYL